MHQLRALVYTYIRGPEDRVQVPASVQHATASDIWPGTARPATRVTQIECGATKDTREGALHPQPLPTMVLPRNQSIILTLQKAIIQNLRSPFPKLSNQKHPSSKSKLSKQFSHTFLFSLPLFSTKVLSTKVPSTKVVSTKVFLKNS